MKKLLFKTAHLIAFVIILSGCSQGVKEVKEITVIGADGKEYTSYRTACSSGDFDAAREYIEKMKLQLTNSPKNYELRYSIEEAEEYVVNEELQFLASLNEEQANNRIILILNQRPVEGVEAAEMACLGKEVPKSYLDLSNALPDEALNFRRYIKWCGNHNSRCSTILGIAIACGNESLAKKILHSFRSDPELLIKDIKDDEHDCDIYAHYTNFSKEAAQKKYNEAVKAGAFNNQ